jgi:hypothetical protein
VAGVYKGGKLGRGAVPAGDGEVAGGLVAPAAVEGVWDTGNYEEKRQPEEVYYFPKVWEMKANFEFEETWDIHAVPLDKQKLDEIKKQKPDEAKKIKDRNKERARKLGRT